MNIKKWFEDAKNILDKEELQHLEVHKGIIQLQLKNNISGEIELHNFTFTAKNAENLKIKQ